MRVTELLSGRYVKLGVRYILNGGIVNEHTSAIVIRCNITIVNLLLIR